MNQPDEFHCWLDPIIEQQAAHYGMTPKKHAELMNHVAECQEQIEKGEIDEQ